MGLGGPSGANVGQARGSITIDTKQAEAVPGIMQDVAQRAAKSMGALDAAANKNAKSLAAVQTNALSASQALNIAISSAIRLSNTNVAAAAQSWATNLQKVATAGMSASQGLNAAIAAAAKASNTNYLSANTTPAFAKQGGGGIGSIANALGFGGGIGAAAGALGIGTGVAGVVQAGKAVIAAQALATAYDRQGIAAANLAGSQGRLNNLMQVYDKATGGIVSKSAALSNVTKLMSVGFADDAQELDKFATAIRGISIAMGASQDTVTQNLILELFTQRGARLDQLGLEYGKVKARADELQAADSSLTDEMAYQNAVLEQAIERFGGLTTSAKGAATGMELAAKAWDDLNLKIGQTAQGPLDATGKAFAVFFNAIASKLIFETAKLEYYIKLWQRLANFTGMSTYSPDYAGGSGISDMARGNANRGVGAVPEIEGAREVRLDWARGITELNAETHAAIIDEETSFGQQRSKTVADYNKSVSREERDFGRQRLRAELDQLDAIADVWKDASRRESKAAADLARNIARAEEDSAENIAKSREDAAERLAELDKDFQKDQKRRQEEFKDDMLSAAGKLDAVALLELRKDRARELRDAEEAHAEQRTELQEQLAERIADEEKSLAKTIKQANEAAARQLEEARENDRLRIEDMKADFTKRKTQEDEDRAIRLGDRAADYAAQLVEMDAQHGLRLNQIRTNAIREREALQLAADDALTALGAADAATRKRHEERELAEEKLWDKFHKHIIDSLTPDGPRTMPGGPVKAYASGGYVSQTGLAYLHAGEFVMPKPMVAAANGMSSGRSTSIGDINITIMGSTNMGYGDLKSAVREAVIEVMDEA